MKNVLAFLFTTFVAVSCSDDAASQTKKVNKYNSICGCKLIFPEMDRHILYIVVNGDSVQENSLKKVFKCIENALIQNNELRQAFIDQSETVGISFFNKSFNAMNHELVQSADTSSYWKGIFLPIQQDVDSGMTQRHEQFVNVIMNTDFRENWEESLNRVLQKRIKWKYFAERVIVKQISDRAKFTKPSYPIGFELILKKEIH